MVFVSTVEIRELLVFGSLLAPLQEKRVNWSLASVAHTLTIRLSYQL